ncbi:MAG TPA: DUF4382 domain-containing protein [Candidatus Sulfotelmatobacter sp.]|jgi:hypothetical protein|nr:DUF4382 domain-containing protein [Candidatus Sulfotelmatobacter sp.]
MFRIRFFRAICGLFVLAALFGCGGSGQLGSGTQNSGNSSVVLAMMDTPPSLVTVLSAQVTLTGATLAPGNVSLLSAPVTVELTRLQTDVAYLATAAKIPAGSYTSVTLTFANPSLTIENDTAATIAGCASATICPIVPTTSAMSATVPLTSFSIASSSTTGLLIDVNLETLLNSALVEDFIAGTSVFQFTPAGTGAPPVGAEDVVGHVASPTMSSNTFTLTNAEASYALKVDSSTTFFQFPTTGSCTTPGFACLQANQILSVDIGIQSDGSLLAKNIVFEDADSSDVEVEGIITNTTSSSQQFDMVVLTASGTGTGLSVGGQATVAYALPPQTTFDIDFLHADSTPISLSTSGFLFSTPADLVAGQQISIRRHGTLAGGQIQADRVRLRSSRFTEGVSVIGSGIITLPSPSLVSGHGGGSTLLVQTFVPTIFFEIGHTINLSNIGLGIPISARGPLFNVNNQRTIAASKVVVQP